MLTLAALPWAAAHRDPEAPLLRLGAATLTASALDRAAAGVAARLEREGAGDGDRVAVLCGNGLAFPPLYYGALRAGCVVAPLSTSSPPAEVARVLHAVAARVLACDPEHAGAAAVALEQSRTGARLLVVSETASADPGTVDLAALVEHPRVDPRPLPPGAPAVILSTSGTTGTPRRALHSHAGLLLNAGAVATEMIGLGADDVQLGALPLAHSFGMSAVLNASLLAGAAVVLTRRPDVAAIERLLAAGEVTVVQAVPTLFARLMTEVSPLTVREVPPGGGEPGDVGTPMRGVVVRVAGGGDEGELEVAAPSMFLGYDGDEGATAEVLRDGLMRTGDLGRVGAGGRVTVTGRIKEVIVRGGNNVAAREVERLLETHPAVAEAAVLGMPDPELGEEVAAALVLRPRAPGDVVAELERLCSDELASYKRPRLWHVLDSLPRTSSGKVRKGELRELLGGRDGRDG
ncbi:MAG: acyl--CoA ligase [Chloroflexi bacterium]|nr:MAG: acyl--CoA ligase [Chloroflexota bacterium]